MPDSLSEYQFAGLLRGAKTQITKCIGSELQCSRHRRDRARRSHPARCGDRRVRNGAGGPFGDHTGYYNDSEWFPVLTIDRITMRRDPIYHSTYTGKPPDEPSVLGVALNEVFVPLLSSSFPKSPISICRLKAAATGWRLWR